MFGWKRSKSKAASSHPTDFAALVEKGLHHTQALQAGHQASWGFGQADRFDVDLEAGLISFIFDGDKVAMAPVQLIGTWTAEPGEFLWGWDHPMCPPADNRAAQSVKKYADQFGIQELQSRAITCDGDDGWGLAGVACLLGDLQGVYRTPNGDNLVYLGFGEIAVSSIA